ncbi:MAG: Ppx/GppA family phosphatase [Alphaproteobacteria bacterium]|nr:Ppx/GppA family phosphatase [Alphaproteobacteria bacterium]
MPNFVGPLTNPVAVIDIGSNSVRLVAYEGDDRAPLPIFNEKVLSGLGRELDQTGMLPDEAMESALQALRRFRSLVDGMRIRRVDALATAAVREARNGRVFVERAKKEAGFDIRVLSGEEEAQYAAYGILSGTPGANGLIGDLGGGSVELVDIRDRALGPQTTLPLGPIRFDKKDLLHPKRAVERVDAVLGTVPWLSDGAGRSFYAVGGAWRSVAKLHMVHAKYHLHIIHNYRINYKEAVEFTEFLSHLSPDTLGKTATVNKRRIETLPFAGMLLNRILLRVRPTDVTLSAYGLREGALFQRLPAEKQAADPLLDACRGFIIRRRTSSVDGEAIDGWLDGAFPDADASERRLRLAACLIADIARAEHPDYRAEHSLLRVLRFPFVGLEHEERAFMAVAVAARHSQLPSGGHGVETVNELLDRERFTRARAIGLGIRLAYTLSGGVASLLRRGTITRDGDQLVLRMPADMERALYGEVVLRRLSSFAKVLGCEPVVQTD